VPATVAHDPGPQNARLRTLRHHQPVRRPGDRQRVGYGPVARRHRHQEFLRFLELIDDAVPKDLDLHLICGNYATHKTPEAKKRLLRHLRFELHFTPASASWINLVERWLAELTNRKLRRSAQRHRTRSRHPQVGH
jgi:hypothetical protein